MVLDGTAKAAGQQLGPDGSQGMSEAVPDVLPVACLLILRPLQLPLVLIILHIQPEEVMTSPLVMTNLRCHDQPFSHDQPVSHDQREES